MTPCPELREPVTVAIAICTFDRAAFLQPLLASLAANPCEGVAIYVVNNGPGEEARPVTQAAGATYIRHATPGLSQARNVAIKATHEDYVHFLDDDVVLPDRFAETLHEVLANLRPQVLGAPVYPRFVDGPPPGWMPQEFFIRRRAREGWNAAGSVSGGNFAVRRDVLAAVGGFDTGLGMQGRAMGFLEEMEFLLRWRRVEIREVPGLYFAEACSVAHREPAEKMRLGYLFRRNWMSHRQRGRLMQALAGHRAHLYRRSLSVSIAIGLASMVRSPFARGGRRRAMVRALVSMAGRLGEWIGARSRGSRAPPRAGFGSEEGQELRIRHISDAQTAGADPMRYERVIVEEPVSLAEAVDFIRSYPATQLHQIAERGERRIETFLLAALGLLSYRRL